MHEVTIRGGKRVERHLCEQCAKGEGLPVQSQSQVAQILGQFIAAQSGSGPTGQPEPIDPSKLVCPTCGTSFSQFRHSGLLGCPACYDAFEGPLTSLLQRAHEGGTHHTGKSPRRHSLRPRRAPEPPRIAAEAPAPSASAEPPAHTTAAPFIQHAERIDALRRQLSEAVAGEQYEIAAQLRDELLRLESERPPGTGEAGS